MQSFNFLVLHTQQCVHTKEPHHPYFNHNNCNLQVSIFQKEQKIETKQGHPPNKLVPPQTQIHLIHSTNKKHHNTKEQVAKNKQYSFLFFNQKINKQYSEPTNKETPSKCITNNQPK
jgi:hypothetical protein